MYTDIMNGEILGSDNISYKILLFITEKQDHLQKIS